MSRWLREPLLHFFAAGAVLFAVAAWKAPPDGDIDARRIEIGEETHAFVRARFRRQWGREPDAEEARAALDEWIREEVLFREGLLLNLAENDPIVRRRVAQKMTALAEASASPLPNDDALLAWFETRRDVYRSAASYSFEQRFYADREDAAAAQRAANALAAIANGEAPVGDLTLLPEAPRQVPASYIVSNYGETFLRALADLPLGRWAGPVRSSLGAHLVRLSDRTPGIPLTFAEARVQVESDWLYENGNAARERFITELRTRYEVVDTSLSDAAAAD